MYERKYPMNKKEALKIYRDHLQKSAAYRMVLAYASYDKETIAPKNGSDYFNRKMAVMAGEQYKIETDPKLIEAVEYLSHTKLPEKMRREIELRKKSLEDVTCFTKEETMEWNLLCSEGWDAWYKAKKTDNYPIFEPYLKKIIETTKERALRRHSEKDPYDTLLDDYEEGMTRAEYDRFFDLIRKELLPLIQKVNARQEEVDDSYMYLNYPIDRQKKFCEKLLKYIGFDAGWGYMGISEHPFTNGVQRNDVRITTSYDDHNIKSTIFSIIHESGHAYYEHQIDPQYDDMIIRYSISSGMHESQSRFLENYIGRRPSFWKGLYPKLQKAFKKNLGNVSVDEFIRGISAARSSLVRTEADELTYPIHILIRYEIEKAVFSGEISTEDLDRVWREKYKEYLGLDVPNATDGILQDVHWAYAYYGYFPTYALGSAIGAQIMNTMEKQIDVDGLLEKGKVKEIEKWLKKNIQHDAAMTDYNSILLRATGEKFNPQYYIDYLKNKYTKLYNL